MKKLKMNPDQHELIADKINCARKLLMEAYEEISKCEVNSNAITGVMILENMIKPGGSFMRIQLNFSDWYMLDHVGGCRFYDMPLIYELPKIEQLNNQRKRRYKSWYEM